MKQTKAKDMEAKGWKWVCKHEADIEDEFGATYTERDLRFIAKHNELCRYDEKTRCLEILTHPRNL